MSKYKRFIWPLVSKRDSEEIHEQTLSALERAQSNFVGRRALRHIRGAVNNRPIQLFGLTFPNVLGMAAGFDKDVRVAQGLATLGFGHIEVGTLTPLPQEGNPKPRIFRLPSDGALINRMGFPNGGVDAALPRLKRLRQQSQNFVLGVSLGKQKPTPLEDAAQDYLKVMRKTFVYADYLAVNISSPNTPGLRHLQGNSYLDGLLGLLMQENRLLASEHNVAQKPILLKIAPDLRWDEIDAIVGSAESQNIAGIIATNTTLSRAGLTHPNQSQQGGMSGAPMLDRSNEIIYYIAQRTRLPIIGVGGVRSADDVRAKLDAGASLVQLYTGLIYEGPGMIGRMLREL